MNDTITQIWNDFNGKLKGFILKKVQDESIANDILQDVFLKIIDHSDTVSKAKNMQQYIYRIAKNTIIDHFRNVNRENNRTANAIFFSEEETGSLNTTIAECCIRPFIDQLPKKYQEALIKTEFEHLSQLQLASTLNISYSGAKSRVQRGKEKLKALILACCNFPSDAYGNLQPAESKDCNCD
jgi:RNA polymerase sigma-70 factor (ECF subfamily)